MFFALFLIILLALFWYSSTLFPSAFSLFYTPLILACYLLDLHHPTLQSYPHRISWSSNPEALDNNTHYLTNHYFILIVFNQVP